MAGHDYSAAKAAILQLTRTAANELDEDGVRVNPICPGAVATAIYGRALGLDGDQAQRTVDFMTTALSNAASIRRAGQPLDIAEAALWLAGDGSAYVNVQPIVVDFTKDDRKAEVMAPYLQRAAATGRSQAGMSSSSGFSGEVGRLTCWRRY
jgi:NAD(P)-dependent dehydrogenase (short-subunit alcohol dehydrogenase family)